jgi:hypothetical protein
MGERPDLENEAKRFRAPASERPSPSFKRHLLQRALRRAPCTTFAPGAEPGNRHSASGQAGGASPPQLEEQRPIRGIPQREGPLLHCALNHNIPTRPHQGSEQQPV